MPLQVKQLSRIPTLQWIVVAFALVLVTCTASIGSESAGYAADLRRLIDHLTSPSTPDEQVISDVVSVLAGENLKLYPRLNTERLEPDIVALLLRLAVQVPYSPVEGVSAQRLERRKRAIGVALHRLKNEPREQRAGHHSQGNLAHRMFFLAAGLGGMRVEEGRLYDVLQAYEIDPRIRIVALDALLAQSPLPSGAKSILLLCSRDPWSYVEHSDVGPPTAVRVYPFRELAYEWLPKLGVKARRILKVDGDVDPKWNVRLTETVIELLPD